MGVNTKKMDQVYVLGICLAALLIVYLAYSAYRGERKTYDGKSGAEEDTETETPNPEEKPGKQIDKKLMYQKKALHIQKLLNNVKKTEGLRETTLTEIKKLESEMERVKKNIDKGNAQYSLRESDVQMAYVSSRIGLIVKSYPRLRNDKDISAEQAGIRKADEMIRIQKGD